MVSVLKISSFQFIAFVRWSILLMYFISKRNKKNKLVNNIDHTNSIVVNINKKMYKVKEAEAQSIKVKARLGDPRRSGTTQQPI